MTRSIPIPHLVAAGALVLVVALGAGPLAAQEADAPISLTPDDPSLEWFPCADFFPEDCQAAILRLGPDGRNSDVLYRIPAGMSLQTHWHTSQERLILISGEFHVEFDDHPPLVMQAGSYGWVPPEIPHSARCADRGTCLLFVAFVDPPDGFPVDGR